MTANILSPRRSLHAMRAVSLAALLASVASTASPAHDRSDVGRPLSWSEWASLAEDASRRGTRRLARARRDRLERFRGWQRVARAGAGWGTSRRCGRGTLVGARVERRTGFKGGGGAAAVRDPRSTQGATADRSHVAAARGLRRRGDPVPRLHLERLDSRGARHAHLGALHRAARRGGGRVPA